MDTWFKESLSRILSIIDRQTCILSAVNSVSVSDNHSMDILKQIQESFTDYKAKVVVLGKSGSGKSSLINATLGQVLLPTNHLPIYDMVAEIQYSDRPIATLYPTEKTGQEPFDVEINSLNKYIVFEPEEWVRCEKKENPYAKVVIKTPLNICKEGVVFVDSPGLDDPTCHDAITLNYLPTADAIVYCINSQSAFSALDKAEIEYLRALGYKSIIFVLTYFDMLEQNDMITGMHDAEDTRRHYTNVLSPYTDLGPEGIFFVGSLPALMGKIKNDMSLLESSHLPKMEMKLEQILFNERGRSKLIKAIYSAKKVNRETRRFLSYKINLYKQGQTSLSGKLNSAQSNLDKAKEKARLISTSFKNGATEIVEGTKDRARSFFLSGILPNVGSWVQECNTWKGVSLWNLKRTGMDFTESCLKCLQAKIEIQLCTWSSEELVPQFILPNLINLLEHLKPTMDEYESLLNSFNNALSLQPNNSQEYGIRRIYQAMSEVVGGDANLSIFITAPIPVIFYPPQLSSLLNSIYIVVLKNVFEKISGDITAIALSSLLGECFGDKSIERRLKRIIGRKVKEKLEVNVNIATSEIRNRVEIITNKILKSIEDSFNTPIDQYQELIKCGKEQVDKNEQQMAQDIVMLKKCESISDELELIVAKKTRI